MGKVIPSVRHDEYNLFPVALLLPAGITLGNSRISFVVANALLFNFPTIVLFAYFFKSRISKEREFSTTGLEYIVALFCMALAPQLWVPVLCGYLGTGGLFLAIAVLILYSRKSFSDQNYWSILYMAFLLSLMVVFRRWYAYWVVGFLVSITIVNILFLVNTYRINFKEYMPTMVKLFLFGGASAGFFICLATPQAIRMLTTDYGDIYSGYKYATSFTDTLQDLNAHFGLLTLASAALGFLFSLKNIKRSQTAIILFLQFWLSFILFTRTQDMGYHHYYILLPSLLYFSCYFWMVLLTIVSGKLASSLAFVILFCLLLLNFTIVFVPPVADVLPKFDSAFSQLRHYPMKRHDIGEIHNILEYFDEQELSEVDKVYVLASGLILNDDILRKGCEAENGKYAICDCFATTAHVDKRDGLPVELFQSKYIVTTEPAQFHLDPKDQQVIGIVRDMVVHQEGFGKNYRKLKIEFTLDENVDVLIYQKIGEKFSEDDLQDISDRFVRLYPAHSGKFLFPSDIFDQLTD
ncbi:hypothetical protein [Desulfocapsa sulfexigens]|uniref:hypothetical protein n=1 Tax=Desulfocapsa sulfexigens TaxID=65555 RepID=UPI0012946869|nr:hypothetical protein [Desulfocapsa sulfexigens]